jgi:hypothetical protein
MADPAAHLVLTAAEAHFILHNRTNGHCNCHHTCYFLYSLWLSLVPHVACYPYYKCCLLWLINAWEPHLLNLLSCDLYGGGSRVWYSVHVMKVVLSLKMLKQGCTYLHKYWRCVRIVGARTVTFSKLHTADPHILYTAIENSVTWDFCTCCAVKSPTYFFVSAIYCLSQYLSM